LEPLQFDVHFHAPSQLFFLGGDISQPLNLSLKALAIL
jgi:hypothetical protein